MTAIIWALIGVVVLGLLCVVVPPMIRAFLKFKGTRVVTCPETHRTVAVEVDATHAALTAVRGDPKLRLQDCTRWPERRDCDQACLKQIEAAPADCLLRTILTKWYAGKVCVLCRKPIPEVNWLGAHGLDHVPALRAPDGRTFAWEELRPETIPELLSTHQPVCWNCHLAESFRRRFPQLVLDRPEH
jgi:hypothetical protein